MTARSLRLSLFVSCCALAAGGCALTFDATTLGVEATMASAVSSPARGEPFAVNRSAVYVLGGLLPLARPSLRSVLATQATSDQRVADLRIRVRSRWTDLLITVLTAGLIVPRTVTFEGVVVQP